MAIFNSYVKLPEGKSNNRLEKVVDISWYIYSFAGLLLSNLAKILGQSTGWIQTNPNESFGNNGNVY